MMVFDNDDIFGINSFREDASYLFDANSTTVRIHRRNTGNIKNLQGDFLGIKTKTFDNEQDLIDINIMSQAPEGEELQQEGYDGRGTVQYEAFTHHDTEIANKDIIEFISDYGYNIRSGDKFRVVFKDFGLYQGQYCYKQFTIIKI